MSTPKPKSPLQDALANVPSDFRARIIKAYLELKSRQAEGRHDSAGLSAGKLCESIARLLQHELKKAFTPFGQQITNFSAECESFSQTPKNSGSDSLRIVIPKALSFLYTLRNKRGIGHAGGDVDANGIDGATIGRVADWVLCELIRIYHSMSLEEADALIASLSTRNIPDIWEVGGKKRILRSDLDFKQKTLLLLYSSVDSAVLAEDLFSWTKYSNYGVYRTKILGQLDSANLIEYDRDGETAIISPLGIKQVEEELLRQPTGDNNPTAVAKPAKRRARRRKVTKL
ncbi:hypothetical protein ABZR86_06865 [Dyella marensis]|uniref:Uncharacterized protein n=1 Tax=Dyella marensis TaxID=500610 RepID=A0A1I1YCB6_9GAMM|nr:MULTISPECIES: hypothetical protein [Dyella]SFE17255.1 hypothetical protein SAMN02799615_00576 [Dyella marensis]